MPGVPPVKRLEHRVAKLETIIEDQRKVLARLNAIIVGEKVRDPSRGTKVKPGRIPGGSMGSASDRMVAYRNG